MAPEANMNDLREHAQKQQSKPVIRPTVGRVVWFWPNGRVGRDALGAQPQAATVAYVHDDRMVNLSATYHDGRQYPVTSVYLLQGDDPVPSNGSFAEWMPYQVKMAQRDAS